MVFGEGSMKAVLAVIGSLGVAAFMLHMILAWNEYDVYTPIPWWAWVSFGIGILLMLPYALENRNGGRNAQDVR